MNKKYKKKYSMAKLGNGEILFCLIPQVLRLLEMRGGASKPPGCFLIKVYWHNFAFSIRLMIFSIIPAIFV